MKVNTHAGIDTGLCGVPVEVSDNYARVEMTAAPRMTVDETGLVHGGFVFGLADHAAMIAVNHPNVVLGAADVRFLKPVRPGDVLVAEASITDSRNRKKIVEAVVFCGGEKVFIGRFDCFVTERHVLA